MRRARLAGAAVLGVLGCDGASEAPSETRSEAAFVEARDPFTDPRDGQVYPRIALGGAVWLGRNLAWEAPAGSFCYENKPANCVTSARGRLYTFDAATHACPTGYHLSTDAEWKALEAALGVPAADLDKDGYAKVRGTTEGKKLKSGGSSGLDFAMTGYAIMSHGQVTGWDGLTTGVVRTYIWTSTRGGAGVYRRRLNADDAHVYRFSNPADGFAITVRCVED